MESCQDHELINLMKVKPDPAEQSMILIKANRVFYTFFFLVSPDPNITVFINSVASCLSAEEDWIGGTFWDFLDLNK